MGSNTCGGFDCHCRDGFYGSQCENQIVCEPPIWTVGEPACEGDGHTCNFSCSQGYNLDNAKPELTCKQTTPNKAAYRWIWSNGTVPKPNRCDSDGFCNDNNECEDDPCNGHNCSNT